MAAWFARRHRCLLNFVATITSTFLLVQCATFPSNNGELLKFSNNFNDENSTVDYSFSTGLDLVSANDDNISFGLSTTTTTSIPITKRHERTLFNEPQKVVLVGYITGSKRKPGDQVYATPGLRISGALTLALARINNDSRLLPAYKLVPLIGETRGDETESISEVARLWRSNVSVIIGPQETCLHEGRFAGAVDLPLFSYYCRMPEASDKSLFPTFVRTVPPISQISVALVSLLKHFGWQHIALLHPRHSPLWVLTADKLVHTLHDYNITVTGVYSWQELFYVHAFFSEASESPFHHLVEQSFRTTRVYVLLMKEKDDALALLDELHERQLLSTNNYAVIGIMMKQYDADQPSSLLQGVFESSQPLKPSRLDALNYYLLIAPSPSQKREYDQFQRDVSEYSSKPPFNYTTALNIAGVGRVQAKARPEAMYLYDAVNIYAHALNQCLSDVDATVESMRRMRFEDDDDIGTGKDDEETRNRDAIEEATNECLHSGRRIVQFILNRPYMSANGLGGMIDSHGDAQGNYTLLRLRKLNDQHVKTSWGIVPAGIFQSRNIITVDSLGGIVVHPTSNLPTLHLFDEVKWPGGKIPLSEPICGFHGERCRPDVAKLIALYGGLSAGCIIIALISGLCYRHFKYEKELSSFVWRIDRDDLLFNDETTNQLWQLQHQQQQQQLLVVQQSPLSGSSNLKPAVYVSHHSAIGSDDCIGEIPSGTLNSTGTNGTTAMRLRNKISSFSLPSQRERKKSTPKSAHPLFIGRFHAKNSDCRRSSLTRRDEAKMSLPTINSDKCEVALFKGSTTVVVKPLGNAVSTIEITRELCKDMMTMKDLHCPNLAQFVGACTTPAAVVWEYCQRGSLRDVLADADVKIDKLFLASFTFDIIAGMQYLHASSLKSHGSLRPTNILVDSKWVLKITDYGVGRLQSQLKSQRHSSTATQHNREKVLEQFIYVAPEILRERRRAVGGTPKGDIYSFAFVLYELFVRKTAMEMIRRTNILLSSEDIIQQIKSACINGYKSHKNGTDTTTPPIRPPMVATTVVVVADAAGAAKAAAAAEVNQSTTLSPAIPDFVSTTIQACWDDDPELRPEFGDIQTRLKPLRKGMKSDNIIDNVMALLERYATNLEDVVTERTKELESEKRRTETLLYEMLPRPVAEQLIHKNYVEAEAFEQVTVYFSDIIQFTNLCAKLTPMDVVTFLNDLYTLFDVVLELYDVYKVETIGDAYMVVSGAPIRNGDMHAAEIASMALHLIDVLQLFKVRPRPDEKCRIRVGIHSGPCAAGVVGRITPRYTLFGDTINTASRYESSSEAMRIHCSQRCQQILDKIGGYSLENRGLIEMKGKGAMESFWLVGESDERSARRRAFFSSNASSHSEQDAQQQALANKVNNRQEKVKAAFLLGRSPSVKSLLVHRPLPPSATTTTTENSLNLPSHISQQESSTTTDHCISRAQAPGGPIFRKFSYRQQPPQQQHVQLHHSTSWGTQPPGNNAAIVDDKPTSSSLGDDAFNFQQQQQQQQAAINRTRRNSTISSSNPHKNSSTFFAMPFPPPSSSDTTSATRYQRRAYGSTITDPHAPVTTSAAGPTNSCKTSVDSSTTTTSSSAIELALMMFDHHQRTIRVGQATTNNGGVYVRRHSSGLPQQQQQQKHSLNLSTSESASLLMPVIREEERSNSLISSVSSRDNVPCSITRAASAGDSKCG